MNSASTWQQFQLKLPHYIKLTRLNSPIGAFLLLWPTLWALWFASNGRPSLKVLFIFVAGTWLTRSAGCAINDFADRHIDKHVSRTAERPLTSGKISAAEALWVAAFLMGIAFVLVLFTNPLTIGLSFVALLLACVYPFMKRYTHFPQVVLGAAFAIAVPMAFAAQTGTLPSTAWAIFIAAVIWAIAYDTFYAMADRSDDIRIGVKSTAIYFGNTDLLVVAISQTITLSLLAAVGHYYDRGFIYFTGLFIAAGMAIRQIYICRHRDEALCLYSFLNNNYLGMVIFLALAVDYLVEGHSPI